MQEKTGQLYVISAPSGAGKSSLISALMSRHNSPEWPLAVSVSHTTRDPRPGEQNGVAYHFVSVPEFEQMIAAEAFFEHAKVFSNYYGTSKAAIGDQLALGIDVFLDIDWQGARQVKAQYPWAHSIFILPPDLATLESRLQGRGQDSQAVIAARMAEAQAEMSHVDEFDFVLINDDFETTLAQFASIVSAQRLRTLPQMSKQPILFSQLLSTS